MKKTLIALVVVLIVGAAAIVTCPDKQAHKDAIMSVINESINDQLQVNEEGAQEVSALLSSFGSSVAGYIIDSRLTIENHFVYSTGFLKDFDGGNNQVSLGFFGHVFTFEKEDLKKAINGQ